MPGFCNIHRCAHGFYESQREPWPKNHLPAGNIRYEQGIEPSSPPVFSPLCIPLTPYHIFSASNQNRNKLQFIFGWLKYRPVKFNLYMLQHIRKIFTWAHTQNRTEISGIPHRCSTTYLTMRTYYCSPRAESNCDFRVTKPMFYHLTTEAYNKRIIQMSVVR